MVDLNAGFPGDGFRGGLRSVYLGKNGGNLMFANQSNDFRHFGGGSFAAFLLFDGVKDGKIAGMSKILETVVEGDQSVGERGKLAASLVQWGKCSKCGGEVFGVKGLVSILQREKPLCDGFQHGSGIERREPDVRVVFTVRIMVVFVLVMMTVAFQQRDSSGAINRDSGRGGQSLGQESFQTCAIHDNGICTFDDAHIPDGKSIVMETGRLFVDEELDLYILCTLSECRGEKIDGISCGGNGINVIVVA